MAGRSLSATNQQISCVARDGVMGTDHVYAPETIIKAYSLGLFPMAESHDSTEIRFFDPEIRGLIPLDKTIGNGPHIPKRLQRRLKQQPYKITINRDFSTVITLCAERSEKRTNTWINRDIRKLYIALHKLGFAHSVEALSLIHI